MTKEFKDYSEMLTAVEKAMRKLHDKCLMKKWSQATEEPTLIIMKMHELQHWLTTQVDGQEAK